METLYLYDLEGNEPVSLIFNMKAKSVLSSSATSTDTDLFIRRADYSNFIGRGAAGDHFYAVLRDATKKEIVKVNVTGSSADAGLQVERGQQGTSAVAWPSGTLIYQDITASDLDGVLQKAVFRTVDYVPDGVLVANFGGEKVYQSDLALWWKSVGATTNWRLIAGELQVATPSMSPEAGSYTIGQTVTIECTTPGASIYYTLDGSTPDETATLYSEPFELPYYVSTTVKAIAVHSARYYTDSEVSTGDYETTVVIEPLAAVSSGRAAWAIACGGGYIFTCTYASPGYISSYSFGGVSFIFGVELEFDSPLDIFYQDGVLFVAKYGTPGGLYAFTFDGATYTLVDSYSDNVAAAKISGDGTYVYVATDTDLRAYRLSGGSISKITTISLTAAASSIECIGGYIYVGETNEYLYAYSFNGTSFYLAGQTNVGATPKGICLCDGSIIIAAFDYDPPYTNGGGAYAYSFDGSDFTLLGYKDVSDAIGVAPGLGIYNVICIGNYLLYVSDAVINGSYSDGNFDVFGYYYNEDYEDFTDACTDGEYFYTSVLIGTNVIAFTGT